MAARWSNVFVGTETGLLKGINTSQKYFKNLNNTSELDKQQEICVMCWGNDELSEICCGLKNRLVKSYDINTETFSAELSVKGGEGPLKGIAKYNGHILTCDESGLLQLWKGKQQEAEAIMEWHVGKDVCRMRQNPQKPSIVATGGEENELKIWDLERTQKTPVFVAKNVPNDFLDIRVPVWVTDMQFFPDGQKIVCCTRHHHIRMYDPRTFQRLPVVNIEFDEYPLMAISLTHRENCVVVGNARGRMALFDLRTKLLVHCFKGFAGSIRDVQCHPSEPLVASCGLDRFLRIHHTDTHQLLHKIYLKSRLNCLLYRQDQVPKESDENMINTATSNVAADGEGPAEDDIWDKIEEADDDILQVKETTQSLYAKSARRKAAEKFSAITHDGKIHLKSKKRRRGSEKKEGLVN